MKKLISVLLCIMLFTFSACKKKQSPHEKNISQLRQEIFVAHTDNYTVFLYPEKRENPLDNDGQVGKIENFVIIKLIFKNQQPETDVFNVQFTINNIPYSGKFEYKPISNLLQCIVKVEDINFNSLYATLKCGNETNALNFAPQKNSSTVNHLDALNYLKENDSTAKELLSLNDYEIRIRLIDNDGYDYWFIGIISNEKNVSFLLDGESAEILAKKDLV